MEKILGSPLLQPRRTHANGDRLAMTPEKKSEFRRALEQALVSAGLSPSFDREIPVLAAQIYRERIRRNEREAGGIFDEEGA